MSLRLLPALLLVAAPWVHAQAPLSAVAPDSLLLADAEVPDPVAEAAGLAPLLFADSAWAAAQAAVLAEAPEEVPDARPISVPPSASVLAPPSSALAYRLPASLTDDAPDRLTLAPVGTVRSVWADSTVSPLDTLGMSRWERVFWGRRGLARVTGLFPTHPDNPTDDLRQIARVRRRMLGLHQTLGLVTVASMAATVVGGQIAVNGGSPAFHEATLPVTIGLYSTTAALAILSPPKIVSFDGGGVDSITIHRWLAVGHVAGMILTPMLAPDGADDARVHQISGYATFATFSAAMLVVTLLRR